jgi:hypothetical protein
MATDGSRIVYNRAFVDQLKPAELEGTLAHEVLHCALGHQCPRGEREPELWNQAADFAINPILIGNGFTLPAGALLDPAFNNLSAEEIYARLLQRGTGTKIAPKQGQQQAPGAGGNGSSSQGGQGHETSNPKLESPAEAVLRQAGRATESSEPAFARPGGFGEVLDAIDEQGQPASPAEKSRQEHEWSIAAEQALRSAKMCGQEPAGVERPLSESRHLGRTGARSCVTS